MRVFATLAAAAALSTAAIGAQAAVTLSKHVVFSDIYAQSPTDSSFFYGPVGGSFDITFDPSVAAENVTSGITLLDLTGFPGFTSPLSYSYDQVHDTMNVGGLVGNVNNLDPNLTQGLQFSPKTNDFALRIGNFTTAPVLLKFSMTQQDGYIADGVIFSTTSPPRGSVTVTDINAPVPLPAGLPLLLGALGVLALTRRRRSAIAG